MSLINFGLKYFTHVIQDMDLLHETRTLIHAGKLLRQPETGFDLTGGGWTDLFVLLFDNYCAFLFQDRIQLAENK
jgi:hypothetical protein